MEYSLCVFWMASGEQQALFRNCWLVADISFSVSFYQWTLILSVLHCELDSIIDAAN